MFTAESLYVNTGEGNRKRKERGGQALHRKTGETSRKRGKVDGIIVQESNLLLPSADTLHFISPHKSYKRHGIICILTWVVHTNFDQRYTCTYKSFDTFASVQLLPYQNDRERTVKPVQLVATKTKQMNKNWKHPQSPLWAKTVAIKFSG